MENVNRAKSDNKMLVFIFLALSYLVSSFHRVSLSVLSVPISQELGIGMDTIGTLGSILFFIYAIIQIPCGYLCDRIGPKKIILFSLIVTTIGSLSFGLSNSVHSLLLSRVLLSIGISTTYIPAITFVRLLFRSEEAGGLTGILLAFGTIGTIVASKPLQLLVDNFSWRVSFYIFAIIPFILFLFIVFSVGDIRIKASSSSLKDGERTKGLGLDRALVSLIIIFTICTGAVQSFQGLWFIPYFVDGYNFAFTTTSNLLLVFSTGYFLGTPIIGRLCDKFDVRKLLPIVSLINVVLWITLGLKIAHANIIFLGILLFSIGFFSAGLISIGFYYVGKFTKIDRRALITSILSFSGYIFTSFLLKFIGGIVSLSRGMDNLNSFFIFYAIIILICAFIFSYRKE
ncbi:MFS transporter [Anaerosphaera multitolerans]|uniref:MFS transporter n=1 Tax=Anaerosphaera multitolerans TaxID=2487351 RepID=A0A437S776_9FIRM|nr:MFS transporter [Anaerosphaera multitolerans]RVU54844.1 MFS transporter [Anaerosphaera multitolerans]